MAEIEVDHLGEPYWSETLTLPPDEEGPVVATLVSRRAERPTGRAVLHVHGFADYFFDTRYADWWVGLGYDFYALDLRKYGRSIREHTTPAYTDDLTTYFAEIELAWARITQRDGHDHVVVTAHSTGGLTVSLWAHDRRERDRGTLAAMVLNSPWLDLSGPDWLRGTGSRVIQQWGTRQPTRVIPRKVEGIYGRSLHRLHEGEHDYNLDWKPLTSWPIHLGWLAAVRRGQATLHAGLAVPCPVLVLSSDRSSRPDRMHDDVHCTDIVLDVEQIRRWATAVGRHVTYAAVPGAIHDVFLSRPDARQRAYDEVERWLTAYT